MVLELLVTLVSDHRFVIEVAEGYDANTQAHNILEGGAIERHQDEEYTLHPVHQVRSVRVQKKGTGDGR